ncbi:MAG TPA: class I SAM-dependent methyltransferase [Gammaproteobacteria bacterium]|nr:class I SAM-dependent methyltransferase [Gammaproteobacteria bacterium]
MSDADRDKWDDRYATGTHGNREHPTTFLARWEARLPQGRALDVACGTGRNAVFLARTGRSVVAVDISRAGLERARRLAARDGADVDFVEADLDTETDRVLRNGPFDLIVLVRYVNRGLVPRLADALADGGCLLVEQHLVSDADVVGPQSAEHRYGRNELLREAMEAAPLLRVLCYRESLVEDPDGRPAALAQLVACRAPGPF